MIPARSLLHPLLALTLLSFSAWAQAQYLVEVVVFSQSGAPLVAGVPPEQDWNRRAVSLEETARSDVRGIDPSRYTLDTEVDKLQSKGYAIKLHRAWTQPAETGLSVAVRDNTVTTTNDNALYPVQGLVSLNDDPLTATVSFWLNHASSEMSEPVSERLHMTRRLRLNETHYLDHTSMGMLIRISRP